MTLGKFATLIGALALSLGFASSAHAASWTTAFQIDFMDSSAADGGYSIVPVSGSVANNSQNDPANCVSGSTPIDKFYLYASNISQSGKDLIARTVLAAYLAGKPIKLEVSGVTCANGRPVYGNVAVYP
jgi:hypothetical protein